MAGTLSITQAEADSYAPYVIAQGVPPSDLVRSLNTYQNAQNVAAAIVGHTEMTRQGFDRGHIRVSHATIACGIRGVRLRSAALRVGWHHRVTIFPRFRSFENSELAVHELVGLARFHVCAGCIFTDTGLALRDAHARTT